MDSTQPDDCSQTTALLSGTERARHGSSDSTAKQADGPDRGPRRAALLVLGVGILVGSFTQSFDLAFLITNYNRRIASDLNSLESAAWIVLAGSISESASQPLYSHVALSRGIQAPLLVAVWLCAQGLLSCSLWPSIWGLLLSRIIVGLGKSGLTFLTVIIISDLVNVTEIPLWRSGVVAVGTLAEISGGPLGSSTASRFGWRATFGIEHGMMLISCVLVTASVVSSRRARIDLMPQSRPQGPPKFDVLGAIALPVAVVVPLVAIGTGGELLPWDHPVEMAMIGVSPVLLALFYRVESKAVSPILPTRFLKSRDVLVVIAASMGVVFAYNSIIFNLSLYVEIQSIRPIEDWALSFVFAARPVGAILAGVAISKSKRFKRLFLACLGILATLYCSLALTSRNTGVLVYVSLLSLIGLTMGIAENCLITALFSTVGKEDRSALYAMFDLTLAFVADISITVSTALMRLLVRLKLGSDPQLTDGTIRKSLSSLEYVRSLPEDLRDKIFEALASAIKQDYFLASGCIVMALLVAVHMKDTDGRGGGEELRPIPGAELPS